MRRLDVPSWLYLLNDWVADDAQTEFVEPTEVMKIRMLFDAADVMAAEEEGTA